MTSDQNNDALGQLLPFYVNGTLDAAQCAKIDQVMAQSPALRHELETLSGLARAVQSGGRDMMQTGDTGDASLDAVLARIEERPAAVAQTVWSPQPQAKPQSLATLLRFLNPKRWHPAVSLALVALAVGQGAAISVYNSDKAESAAQVASLEKRVGDLEFELASGPGGAATGSVLVEIRPDASWADVEALLRKEGLAIVGGPSDGALTLLAGVKGSALDALIARLRASPLIASADKIA